MSVRSACVANARIQLFCDYNATRDWPVGWLASIATVDSLFAHYVFLREVLILGDRFKYDDNNDAVLESIYRSYRIVRNAL